jgi:Putative transposase
MKYLAQYVFRVAISNNRIIKYQDGFVTFKYKDSKNKVYKIMKLTTEEFIRRFLQHVLPGGFVKVRYFGLFATKNRNLLSIVKILFDSIAITTVKSKTAAENTYPVICCPVCGNQMNLVLTLQRLKYNDISPPLNYYSFIINGEQITIN